MQGRSIKRVVSCDLTANTLDKPLGSALLHCDSRFPSDSREVFGQVSSLTKAFANEKSESSMERNEPLACALHELSMPVVCKTTRYASMKTEEALYESQWITLGSYFSKQLVTPQTSHRFPQLKPKEQAQSSEQGAFRRANTSIYCLTIVTEA